MYDLYLIKEIFTNGYISNALISLSFVTVFTGMFVIICKNPIFSILFLIGLFASISLYLIMIGFTFIALSYLIVYVGAVSILFLFILMLIDIRVSELQSNTNNSIILSLLILIFFNYNLFQVLPYSIKISSYINFLINFLFDNIFFISNSSTIFNLNNNNLLFTISQTWDANLLENSHITSIGNIIYSSYNMWLFIVSLILILAMVGCIIITIKQSDSTNIEQLH